MDERDWLAQRFQEHQPRLRAVAYRMLGSTSEADDAVQEAWIRLSRSNAGEIDNFEAWLVTVVGRVALNMLRARKTRREEPIDAHLPDPIVDRADGIGPEHEALLADSVGLALLVVLETLTPAERLAYVLHDMFSVPFDEIGAILDRSPEAARQLASRGRRRIRGADTTPDAAAAAQQEVVEAFLAAARDGDFDALVAVLDPDIVLREDWGSGTIVEVRGAENVARGAMAISQLGLVARPALINGAAGWVSLLDGEVYAIGALTLHNGRITTMDILLDPAASPASTSQTSTPDYDGTRTLTSARDIRS
jgi:RNA polymerase sigma factor (sigma-70 family)